MFGRDDGGTPDHPGDGGSSDGGSSSSSESGDDEPRKKHKLRPSDMPWHNRPGETAISQNPSCAKSAALIQKFNRDLKSTKLYIKLSPGAPRGIPTTEWEHILKGEAVDLDKILSSLHRVTVDPERKARVGDTEISITEVDTKRKVETSSEWSTAWRSASRAIAFVFEHRDRELSEYGDYIERLFATKKSSSHGQVILFDRGVRNEVGGGQSLLLTDYAYFTSLYAATLQDDGVEYHRGRRSGGEKEDLEEEVRNPRSALGTTARRVVGSHIQDVITCTPASCVEKEVMASTFVASEDELFGMRPKYLRYNLWDEGCVPKMTVAEWTHTAHPLPSLPAYELQNEPACKTVLERPDLFVIVTPIKVEVLESLLNSHPNRPFVESVLNGLREGFWPWANTMLPGYLLTHDESRPLVLSEEKKDFVANQLKHERDLGRVTSDFGETLLPGMDCMPHYVVPKPHSTNWRLVNDLSAGPYSLNGMVEHDEVIGYPLDNLSHLGDLLLRKRRENPSLSFVAWKSDIAEAYRMCPMHKLWQLKQVVRIEKKLCVDRVNMFGGSYSQAIFTSVNALVAWVAKVERAIEALVYVDDSFGIDEEGNLVWYGPYGKYYPEQQTRLLQLWDKIGIPHKETKQVFGSQLTILGIEVNTIDLTFTLTQESKEQLEAELLAWCQRGVRKKVKEWQRLAGWVNWVLNVYPYLRPALNNIYAKLKGKGQEMRIWANNAIREDLMWAKGIVQRSDGIRLLSAALWDINEATCVAMTDACPRGLGFWYPNLNLCFASSTPTDTLSTEITFFEALAVLSALYDAVHRFPPKTRMVIFTDNFASVAMFSTFRALPEYNCILRAAVDLILEAKFDLRVVHVSGDQNDVADALSRGDFMRALQSHPNLSIHSFEPYQRVDRHQSPPLLRPPRNMLGAAVI